MADSKKRSMAVTLLIVVGITIVGVLISAGIQVLLFGKTVTAVSSAVGVVFGMVAARQLTLKSKEPKEQSEASE
jgi:hypothetical protein